MEGAELGEGPAVFAVPELLAGPEDDTGCFRFLPVWFFEPLKHNDKNNIRNLIIYNTHQNPPTTKKNKKTKSNQSTKEKGANKERSKRPLLPSQKFLHTAKLLKSHHIHQHH